MKTETRKIPDFNNRKLLLVPVIAVILIFCMFCSKSSNNEMNPSGIMSVTPLTAGSDDDGGKVPYTVVEEMPMFPGGDIALLNYIAQNTAYPAEAKANNIQGKVIVRFCVTEKGDIDKVTVLKGVDPVLDAESVRVVKTLPRFEPGRQSGQPVPVWYVVPITFALR